MKGLDSHKIGCLMAGLMGFFHAVWALLVACGFAQWFLDFVFWLHFITNPYRIEAFGITRMIMLVAFTSGVGYLIGYIFAHVWNLLHHPTKK